MIKLLLKWLVNGAIVVSSLVYYSNTTPDCHNFDDSCSLHCSSLGKLKGVQNNTLSLKLQRLAYLFVQQRYACTNSGLWI